MSYKDFDWTVLLTPEQRAAEMAKREATDKWLSATFPPKRPDEVDRIMALSDAKLLAEAERDGVDLAEVGRKGREAFERAVNIVDGGDINIAIMHVCDLIAGNPSAVIDQRAWQHLAVYMPVEVLTARLQAWLKKKETEKTDEPSVTLPVKDGTNG